jgi:hypothetical protein
MLLPQQVLDVTKCVKTGTERQRPKARTKVPLGYLKADGCGTSVMSSVDVHGYKV